MFESVMANATLPRIEVLFAFAVISAASV